MLGDAYVQLGDDAHARWAYDRAVEINPGAHSVLIRKGDLEWMLGDPAGASAAWRAACDRGGGSACRRVEGGGITISPGSDWRQGWGTGASHVVVPGDEPDG
ncbi:MAG: tetratricopeptide repeat protein [Myxococcota bacterium]|nr:tetratricopeptide repeat protein [Myxococcota bacterium]